MRSKNNIRFVLVRPRNPQNIGAAARAMANFGFEDLAVVDPFEPIWRETVSAVNAEAVIRKARRFSSLQEAIANSTFVIGTSAGSKRAKNKKWIGSNELQKKLETRGRKISVVFGPEKTGLTNQDLAFCHYIVTLPTDKKCPSLNLSHAVAITAFILNQTVTNKKKPISSKNGHIPVSQVEQLIQKGTTAFDSANIFKGWNAARREKELRRALYQWNLNPQDISLLHGLFRWITIKGQG